MLAFILNLFGGGQPAQTFAKVPASRTWIAAPMKRDSIQQQPSRLWVEPKHNRDSEAT